MAHPKSIKTIIIELVLYAGMFAIVAHLCANLFDRYMMQTELTNIKSDLTSLGMSLGNIEMAYDTLCDKIQNLPLTNTEEKGGKPSYTYTLSTPRRHVYEAYVVNKPIPIKADDPFTKLVDAETNIFIKTKDFMQNFEKSKKDFMQACSVPVQDKYTITKRGNKYTGGIDGDSDDICKCVQKYLSSVIGAKNPTPPSHVPNVVVTDKRSQSGNEAKLVTLTPIYVANDTNTQGSASQMLNVGIMGK